MIIQSRTAGIPVCVSTKADSVPFGIDMAGEQSHVNPQETVYTRESALEKGTSRPSQDCSMSSR